MWGLAFKNRGGVKWYLVGKILLINYYKYMREGGQENNQPTVEQQRRRKMAMESVTHYYIWTSDFLENLGRLEEKLDEIKDPKDLLAIQGDGSIQLNRILFDVYQGRQGAMSGDLDMDLQTIEPPVETSSSLHRIPYDVIRKIHVFLETSDKSQLPDKAEIAEACANLRPLVNELFTARKHELERNGLKD